MGFRKYARLSFKNQSVNVTSSHGKALSFPAREEVHSFVKSTVGNFVKKYFRYLGRTFSNCGAKQYTQIYF